MELDLLNLDQMRSVLGVLVVIGACAYSLVQFFGQKRYIGPTILVFVGLCCVMLGGMWFYSQTTGKPIVVIGKEDDPHSGRDGRPSGGRGRRDGPRRTDPETIARREAAQKLVDLLSETSMLLTADIYGRPRYSRSREILQYQIAVQIDPDEYADFLDRAHRVLDDMSLRDTSTLVTASPLSLDDSPIPVFQSAGMREFAGPDLTRFPTDAWCLWLQDSLAGRSGESQWRAFVMDVSVAAAMHALNTTAIVKAGFLDEDGTPVLQERIELTAPSPLLFPQDPPDVTSGAHPGLISTVIPRSREAGRWAFVDTGKAAERQFINVSSSKQTSQPTNDAYNIFIAPYAFTLAPAEDGGMIRYQNVYTLTRETPLSLKQFERIRRQRCSVIYRFPTEFDLL